MRLAEHTFFAAMYMLFFAVALHAAYGVAHTLAVKLPPHNPHGCGQLRGMPLDYAPKLYCVSTKADSRARVAVFLVVSVLGTFLWGTIKDATQTYNLAGFGWGWLPDVVPLVFHYLVMIAGLLVVAGLGARQGSDPG